MLNVVVLMGRLCADPELKHTPNNVSVTTFRIAVDRKYAKSNEDRQTDFIEIVAWRNTAEFICRYFNKGSMIALQGSLRVENYTNRDGNKRSRCSVVADNVSFCGNKQQTPKSDNTPAAYGYTPSTAPAYSSGDMGDFQALPDDDLPF